MNKRADALSHRPWRRSGAAVVACMLALVIAGAAAAARAGDEAAGRTKAQACTTCHGPLGISQMPSTPNLAGQPATYLVEQLKAYRSGKRASEVMAVVAKPLTDADISDLAAWYASIEISAKSKP
jgi:cytochrome c553